MQEATDRLATRTVENGSKAVQKAAVDVLKSQVGTEASVMAADGKSPEEIQSAAQASYAEKLVNHNVIDQDLATEMAAGVRDLRGFETAGELSPATIAAYTQYLEFTKGDRATDKYMADMFSKHPEALTFFQMATEFDLGSADTDRALRLAAKQLSDPPTSEHYVSALSEINSTEWLDNAMEHFTKETGLTGFWNTVLGRSSPGLREDAEAVSADEGLRTAITANARTQMALTPQITPDAAMRQATAQAHRQGANIFGNYVQAPRGETMLGMAGMEGEDHRALNEAVQDALIANLDQLPKSAMESIRFAARSDKMFVPGEVTDEMLIDARDWIITMTPVEGDMHVVMQPREAVIDNWSKALLGSGNQTDLDALAMTVEFSLKEAGAAWNAKELEPTVFGNMLNATVDHLKGNFTALSENEMGPVFGNTPTQDEGPGPEFGPERPNSAGTFEEQPSELQDLGKTFLGITLGDIFK